MLTSFQLQLITSVIWSPSEKGKLTKSLDNFFVLPSLSKSSPLKVNSALCTVNLLFITREYLPTGKMFYLSQYYLCSPISKTPSLPQGDFTICTAHDNLYLLDLIWTTPFIKLGGRKQTPERRERLKLLEDEYPNRNTWNETLTLIWNGS